MNDGLIPDVGCNLYSRQRELWSILNWRAMGSKLPNCSRVLSCSACLHFKNALWHCHTPACGFKCDRLFNVDRVTGYRCQSTVTHISVICCHGRRGIVQFWPWLTDEKDVRIGTCYDRHSGAWEGPQQNPEPAWPCLADGNIAKLSKAMCMFVGMELYIRGQTALQSAACCTIFVDEGHVDSECLRWRLWGPYRLS